MEGFKHHGIEPRWIFREYNRGCTKRDTNGADSLAGKSITQPGDSRFHIFSFPDTEGDTFSRRFTVRPKIDEEGAISLPVQKPGTTQHFHPVAPERMNQQYHSSSAYSVHQPSMHVRACSVGISVDGNLHRFDWQIDRERIYCSGYCSGQEFAHSKGCQQDDSNAGGKEKNPDQDPAAHLIRKNNGSVSG